MPLSRRSLAAIMVLASLVPAAHAEKPPSPLRLVPADADLLLTVPDARRFTETFTGLALLRKLEPFSAYRELLDSTRYRRFRQFLAYYEKEMSAPWPQLLDEVAGGGIVVSVKFEKSPAPSLAIIQGRDEKRVREFAHLAVSTIEQELARQDEKAKIKRGTYEGIETYQVGDELFAAVAGSAIFISNQEQALQSALKLHLGRGGKSFADIAATADAAILLPPKALASLWLNLEAVKKNPAAAAAFKVSPRNDPVQTVLFGGYLDVAGRSSYLAAALVREGDEFLVTIRMPKGRKGMGADYGLHVPPLDAPDGRPLLEPAGTLFSTSFYLDVGRIWSDRHNLFPDMVAKSLEKSDMPTNPFLSGIRISRILPQLGAHHRFVAASQAASAYSLPGGVPIPAFALVSEMREPEKFGSAMEAILRSAALLGGFKVKMKLVDEKIGAINLVGVRFADDQPEFDEGERTLFRFYSPCFARVGNQFLWSSTIELGRELAATLQSEKPIHSTDAVHSRFNATGAAQYLQSIEELLVTQGVLDRAVPADVAATEVKEFLSLLRTLGPLDVSVRYDEDRFRYDLRLKGVR
jgi:hypothetical protein